MKIEKLNEDKIRITLNLDDLKEKNIDFHSFMSNSIESQELFLDMLDKAEEEVGFITDDYKIMIEAIAMANGNFVLTVTRIVPEKDIKKLSPKVHIKRKIPSFEIKKAIYSFSSFDDFCDFCTHLTDDLVKDISTFAKNQILYSYNNKYYLVFENINKNFKNIKSFASSISEFGHFVNSSELFERKLLEYGEIIVKENAIITCRKHFA